MAADQNAFVKWDDNGIHLHEATVDARMSWKELELVFAETTNEGPIDEDLFYCFLNNRGDMIRVPNSLFSESGLLDELEARLSGLDLDRAIRAAACTENAHFLLWNRSESPARAGKDNEWLAGEVIKLFNDLNTPDDSEEICQKIFDRYLEPQRQYHTLQHIIDCWILWDSVRGKVKRPNVVELALLYHDIIYDPRAKDNEAQSAAFFLSQSSGWGLNETDRREIADMIRATRHHLNDEHSDEWSFFLDIDMSILGQHPILFMEYERDIRSEYRHVPDDLFYLLRGRFLGRLLARDQIFSTVTFYQRFESQARQNLTELLSMPPYGSEISEV